MLATFVAASLTFVDGRAVAVAAADEHSTAIELSDSLAASAFEPRPPATEIAARPFDAER